MADKKNMYYILAVVVVIVVIAFFVLRKPAEAPPVAPPPAVEEPVEETVLPEPEVPTEYAGEAEMVTSAVCSEGKIGAVLTNTAEVTLVLKTDVKFLLRGLVVKEPGCDKTEIAPGESTTCTSLNGAFPVVSGKNEALIRTTGGKEGKATVTCE